jgi:hypothetical protein
MEWTTKYMKQTLQYLKIVPPDIRERECHWNSAQRRYNVLLSIILAERIATGTTTLPPTPPQPSTTMNQFVISNYHMPCVYYDEKVMVLHSDLCLARVQQIAHRPYDDNDDDDNNNNDNNNPSLLGMDTSTRTIETTTTTTSTAIATNNTTTTVTQQPQQQQRRRRPYILAGDFNIKPNDTAYQLLTTGQISITDPAYPTPPTPKQQQKSYQHRTTTGSHQVAISSSSLSINNNNNNNNNHNENNDSIHLAWKPLQIEPVRSAYAVHAFEHGLGTNNQNSNTTTTTTTTTTATASTERSSEDDNTTTAIVTTTTNDNDPNQQHHHTTHTKYHASGTGEPDFTNFSQMGGPDKPPFIDTLDYIFISPNDDSNNSNNINNNNSSHDRHESNHNKGEEEDHSRNDDVHHRINVQNVLPLPHRDEIMEVYGPYPNAIEPSDHAMIAADLDITFTTSITKT